MGGKAGNEEGAILESYRALCAKGGFPSSQPGDYVELEDGVATFHRKNGVAFMMMPIEDYVAILASQLPGWDANGAPTGEWP